MDTLDLLEAWGQPWRVRLAGCLHQAYTSPGIVASNLFDLKERALLVDLAGTDGERLISLFALLDRDAIVAAAENKHDAACDPFKVHDSHGAIVVLSRRDVGDLLAIHLASAAQSSAADGSPGTWLASASRLAWHSRRFAETAPTVFERGTARVDSTDEDRLIQTYRNLFAARFGSHQAQEHALGAISKVVPWVSEPFICLGLFALAAGDFEAAVAHGERATSILNVWNTSWDKRLSGEQWLALANFLRTTGPLAVREREFLAGRTRSILESATRIDGVYAQLEGLHALAKAEVTPAGVTSAEEVSIAEEEWSEFDILPSRFAEYMAGLRENIDRPLMGFYPGLTARPWWDPAEFELVAELEKMSDAIIAEFLMMDRRMFAPSSDRISRSGAHDVCILFEHGRRNADVAVHCPVTTKIVEMYRTVGGRVYFERIGPALRGAPHRSSTNVRLRCNLGLTPSTGSGITVDKLPERLRQRRCLVFDESFEHEQWNRSDGESAALVIDIWHPDLTPDEITLLEGLNRMLAVHADALYRHRRASEGGFPAV